MIDVQSIMADMISKMIDSNIGLVVVGLIIAIIIFSLRYDIGYDFDLNKRSKNRLAEKSILAILVLGAGAVFYLYNHQYYFILSLIISFILTYFLYVVGIVDMLVNRLER